jgi:type I restriction enzyme S subunit
MDTIKRFPIPLPPLEEQKRIVAKIEELMPYVDKYDVAYSEVEELNKKFPEDMQKSILQYAIQGKLVEQREEDGTAEDLYKQIQEDMQKQIKAGKVKRPKKLPTIKEDEIPFDIPESWKWVRLGEIGFTNIGLTYKPSDISNSGTIVLRSSNIQNGQLDYNDLVKINKDIPLTKMCQIGDILICARNGSKRLVGKSALIDVDGMSFGAFMAIYRSLCNEYILHIINSAYFRNTMLPETGTTTINQITQETLRHCMIPLPPLAEQKRIVEKIEELLPYTNQLVKKVD